MPLSQPAPTMQIEAAASMIANQTTRMRAY
jgi:hypothetical protein